MNSAFVYLLTIILSSLFRLNQASDYRRFSLEVLIPFDYSTANTNIPFTDDVFTTIKVGTGTTATIYKPIIDTGTCGLVISASGFPNWKNSTASEYPIGWEFLSSSKRLYSGRWIPTDIQFTNANVEVTSRVPTLAVEEVTICPNYNETTDTNICPTPTSGSIPIVTSMPTGIQVMGVGFGREADGQPQGTPDKNPFLNVQLIDGHAVSGNRTFRNGYIISIEGITIGLTARNTAVMNFTKLAPRLTNSSTVSQDARDWAAVPACMSINGATCTPGSGLIDTGVSQSYMTLPLGTLANRTIFPLLDNGSTVDIHFGSPGTIVACENFTVGDADGIEKGIVPSSVRLSLADPVKNPPHVNTGRHFLRRWRLAFDAIEGRLGFAPV
ncbi:outer membrane autotransporter barrel protein [Stipitochalara longipes BDJ]|nr:outer membrane autotransporter barrel protein [Stipitochalara longipes BDJ]